MLFKAPNIVYKTQIFLKNKLEKIWARRFTILRAILNCFTQQL